MKSKDFQIDEAINWGNIGTNLKSGASAVGSAIGKGIDYMLPTPQEKKDRMYQSSFVDSFTRQFEQNKRLHPNVTIDDFLNQYWTKNRWDINSLPPSYTQSLNDIVDTVNSDPSTSNIKKLANSVYSIALMLPTITNSKKNKNNNNANNTNNTPAANTPKSRRQSNTNQATPQPVANQNPAAGNGQVDPNTNQIIAKIRSIKNTPDEIDDLVDIIAISLFKLYKIAPKNYKRIIMSLFNNGGRPSMPGPNNVAPQTIPQSEPEQEQPTVSATSATSATSAPKGPATGSLTGWQQGPTASQPTTPTKPVQPPVTTPTVTSVPATTTPVTDISPKEPSLNDTFPPIDTSKFDTTEPELKGSLDSKPGRNADFTRGGKGVFDPDNTDVNDKIFNRSLDRRTKGIQAARDEMDRNSEKSKPKSNTDRNDISKKISQRRLDKQINARQAIQKAMTPKSSRAGLPQ
jgi:hypothetical protein